jgi:hypothetical protein
MAAAALDNANPTILSASQLPTRQTKKAAPRYGPDSVYGLPFLDKLSLRSQPWDYDETSPSTPSGSDSEDHGDDLLVPDAIDEQEIYGKTRLYSLCLLLFLSIGSNIPFVS